MSKRPTGLVNRALIGAIAGIAGTVAMTSALARMHRKLPVKERYPPTPRQLVDQAAAELHVELGGEQAKDAVLTGHVLYGAASGALLGVANVALGPMSGGAAGAAIWLSSYMGWIPASGLLKTATRHPARRNLLMLGAHVVWGVTTARAMRELVQAREMILHDGLTKDAPVNRPAD